MDNDQPKSSTGLSKWTIYSFYTINAFIVQVGKKKLLFLFPVITFFQ